MRRIQIWLLISLFFSLSVFGQDEKPAKENNGHHLGAFVGASSGYGISYRYFKNKLGFQITTIPIFSNDETYLSLGGEVLVSIHRGSKTNFYSYLGSHYNYQHQDIDYSYYEIIAPFDSGDLYYTQDVDFASISGVGVGFELVAGKRISFNWQLGYGFFYLQMDDPKWKTSVDAGFGLFYKF